MSDIPLPRRVRSNLRRTVLKTAAFLIYCAVILEITARVFVAATGLRLDTSYGYPSDLFVEDQERGYALRPGFRGTFPNEPYDDIPIRINDSGFRDDDFESSSSIPRIAVVGDSITFGAGVRAEDRYTERLERLACHQSRCEVVNLGVNGYQVENYIAVLRDELPRLEPELVVLGFCMNDIQDKSGIEQVAAVMRRGARARLREVAASSTALRLVSFGVRAATWDADEYRHRWIRRAARAWDSPPLRMRLARNLETIQEMVREAGGEVIAIVFPERTQLEDFDSYGGFYRDAIEHLSEAGIPAVSGRDALGVESGGDPEALDDLFLKGDNIHFTPEGHARLAKALVPLVREKLALSQ